MKNKTTRITKYCLLATALFSFGCNNHPQPQTYKFVSSSMLITSDKEDKQALLGACKYSSVTISSNDIIVKADCIFGKTEGFLFVRQDCLDSTSIEKAYGSRIITQLNLKRDSCYKKMNVKIKFNNKKEDSCIFIFTSSSKLALLYDVYLLEFNLISPSDRNMQR